MEAAGILTSVAILMLAAAMWDDLSRNERVTPARKTYLIVDDRDFKRPAHSSNLT